MADHHAAEDWLFMPRAQVERVLGNNTTWPFTNVSKGQFFELLDVTRDRTVTYTFLHIAGSIISGIGILCTVLLICSLWRKAIVQKNSFYIAMLTIAIIDLFYIILCLFHYS